MAENEDRGDTSVQPSSRKPRTTNPSSALWQQNKKYIQKLYMTDRLPLSEVRRRMECDHNFSATDRMYKNKFKIWRWSKNLPQEKAIWMSRKIIDRRPMKKTVFHWNNQEWTEERLMQICGNLPGSQSQDVACAPTPDDIYYKTPGTTAETPLARSSPSGFSRDRREQRSQFYLDSEPVNLDLNRTTISGLHRLLDRASHAASDGRIDDANADFRDAVSGLRCLLSPTNEETLRAGYLYASFYMNCADVDRAEAVLTWMSKHHLKKWGPGHEKTHLHCARIVELFQSWGLRDRAGTFAYRVLNGIQDDGGEPLCSQSAAKFAHSFPDLDAIDRQLDRLDNVLEVMISQCEDQSGNLRMSLHACRAKCALAKLHNVNGRIVESHQTLKNARESISPLLVIRREPMARATLDTAKDLAYMFHKAQDDRSCNDILDEVIASLEAHLCVSSCDDDSESTVLLDFVQSIAFNFHQNSTYDKCRYWAERGLGLAIRIFGRQSIEAQKFENMLKRDNFSMRAPLSVDGLMSYDI
ncbi:hypothetical protein F4679DRAFT_575264 [Xylaria curta]|nr:hypothetical protein F4679DRAFT_575264 [Xylaria curta]